MSGKTARRKRAKAGKKAAPVTLKDAKRLYADIMIDLMAECGIDDGCTVEQINGAMSECADAFLETYDEYLTEVIYGGDEDAAKLDLLMLSLNGTAPILLGT